MRIEKEVWNGKKWRSRRKSGKDRSGDLEGGRERIEVMIEKEVRKGEKWESIMKKTFHFYSLGEDAAPQSAVTFWQTKFEVIAWQLFVK